MEILSKDKYFEFDKFVKKHKNGSFMQTTQWAKLKADWGHEIIVSRDVENNIKGAALVLIKSIPIVKYSLLYSPRGPVFDYDDFETLMDILEGVKFLSKKYKAYEFKMDPFILDEDEEKIKKLKSLGFHFKRSMKDFETLQTRHNYMLLNLKEKTEDEIFESFHKKWRYNIRVAIKHNVTCKYYNKSHLKDFYRIYKITSVRDDFLPRPIEYFERLMDELGDKVRLYISYYDNKAVSGAITTNYAGKTCYVYGASDNEYRNVMPNHLMQWEMIKWAKETGCEIYDFQGIPIQLHENNEMYGVYKFKKGFNGECVMFAGEFDYILNHIGKNIVDKLFKARKYFIKLKKKFG